MAAVILGWNPNRRIRWDYRAVVEQVAESGRFLDCWRVGRRRNIRPGTQVWLLLQGGSDAGSGLLGHGIVMSETYEAAHTGPEATDRYISVAFDALLPLGEQIRPDILVNAVPDIRWGGATRRSVLSVPPSAEPGLRRLWRELGPPAVEPTELISGTYPEEAVSRIDVNRYERNRDAHRMCLAFHGTSCAACGFSFETSYGEIGKGFIHVHHTVPASMLGSGYELDPVADLVPLCPNCHAMAHRGVDSPRSVAELRNIIATSGHLNGRVVSEAALEAQEDARRILEGRRD